MCSLSGLQIILRGHIFDTITENFCRTAVFQTFENSESNNFVQISCNVKGLVFDFYLNRKSRKRNKCWLAACSCDLFTYHTCLYIGRNAS